MKGESIPFKSTFMHIAIFGASGLIARSLRSFLLAKGLKLTSVCRNPTALVAKSKLETVMSWEMAEAQGLTTCDALIVLTGAPIFGSRWTDRYKKELIESRCEPMRRIGRLISAARCNPHQVLTASAVGIYPPSAEAIWEESSCLTQGSNSRFIHQLCLLWEKAATDLETKSCSVTKMRFANVMTAQGGMLGQLAPWFKRGLGAQIGDGRQMMSWIHIHDLCNAIWELLMRPLPGVLNLSAPMALEQRVFAKVLAKTLKAPLLLRVPKRLLHLLWGERACLLTDSCATCPKRLIQRGYRFIHPELTAALISCFSTKSAL